MPVLAEACHALLTCSSCLSAVTFLNSQKLGISLAGAARWSRQSGFQSLKICSSCRSDSRLGSFCASVLLLRPCTALAHPGRGPERGCEGLWD